MGHCVSTCNRIDANLCMGDTIIIAAASVAALAACTILTKEDKKRYNFRDGDSEGFVNIPLSIDDVEVSGFFSESDEGYVKVSLRSKNWFSANRFSNQYFNGGGHEKAAGGRLFIPIAEVPEYFRNSLEQFLHNEQQAK